MTFTVIINLCFLAAAAFCLAFYFTAYDEKCVKAISRVLFSAAAAGIVGAAVCAALSKSKYSVFIIFGETVLCLTILMISFCLAKKLRTAVLRLCLAPLWAMLIVLSAYALSAISGGSAVIIAFGVCAALTMELPAACDFLRLHRRIMEDASIAEERKARKKAHKKKREEKCNISKKRRELKHGKARK